MWVFYSFAALLLLQSLVSLRGGARYLDLFRRELERPLPDFTPFASVFVPCRGLDQGFRENISALFRQDYPRYELVFAFDDAADAALAVVEGIRREFGGAPARDDSRVSSRVVIAGRAEGRGQKVHNLAAAVLEVDPECEVFVFVDTDARVRADWLRSLVAPLADGRVGAATGYRWFLPTARGGLSSHLRSVWNASIASALGGNVRRNFCWGGSTAIPRVTFDRLDILAEWRGALSDDYALTRALQRADLPVTFAPQCLTASHEDCSWRELFEFTTRQLKITRVYAPRLWRIVLASNLIFCSVFYGGVIISTTRALRGQPFALPLAFVALIFVLGALKAHLRLRAVSRVLARDGVRFRGGERAAHLTLWTLTAAVFLWNATAAAFSRRIKWRGIVYDLVSPTETRVVAGAPARDAPEVSPARRR
ncbi:MAG TPA: glycosyltransferase family 2 protein [Pyrinomonadaceae bacterium]|jgi:cellulose synthase/poly-beta-1,6-N-acetylglucosamine synthase-like glycosyltransferase|nr:glycosyltransferase family 2 protein [Pyrinomonadaceae bacterium]